MKKLVLLGVVLTVGAMLVLGGCTSSEGSPAASSSPAAAASSPSESVSEDGVQNVEINLTARGYAPITVKKGVPVRWNIKAAKGTLTGCNNAIQIPTLGIEKELAVGDNIIEFTPTETGTIPYFCWMGMIESEITVVDDTESN